MRKGFWNVKAYICCYIGIVVVSAVVNWTVFKLDTTSFLISEQLNKHLVRYDLVSNELDLSEFHANAKDLMPVSVNGFVGIFASKLMRISDINDSLSVYNRQLELLKGQLDSVQKVAVFDRISAADTYRTMALKNIEQRQDSLMQLMAGVDSTELIAKGLLIERANLELEYAIKNKAVTDHILENMRSFIPEKDLELLDGSSSRIVSCSVSKSLLEQERSELVRAFREDVNHFHLNRSSSVSFLDFLYYSICVSTTVSFGDIVPNNGWTRFLAIAELLACVVLVSLILGGIARGKRNRDKVQDQL